MDLKKTKIIEENSRLPRPRIPPVEISEFPDEIKNIVKLAILSHHNKTIDHLEQAVFEENNAAFLLPGINLETMNTNRKEAYEEASFCARIFLFFRIMIR